MESENLQQRPTQDPRSELDQLASDLQWIKQKIADHQQVAKDIEERISALVGVKEEGTISQKTKNWRISTTGGLTRSIEMHNPEYFRLKLGQDRFDDLIRVKLAINTAEFRKASPKEVDVIMQHMVIKPKKVSVKLLPREVSNGV